MIDTFNISFLFDYGDYIFYRFSTPHDFYILTYFKTYKSYELLPFNQFVEFFKNGDYDV